MNTMIKTGFLFFIIMLISLGCDKVFIADVESTPKANFDAFWLDVDRNYSYLAAKNIDWDAVYEEYESQITENTTDQELFNILDQLVQLLEDGHVNIWTPFASSIYDVTAGHPTNANTHALNYIVNQFTTPALTYGTIRDQPEIGYIQIESFGGSLLEFNRIEEVITAFQDKKGIIIDVRSNGGGSDFNGLTIAGRFADQTRLYRLITFRNGPEWDDFAEWSENYVNPMGNVQYQNPVVLLTNRGCFSACEGFTRMMKAFPNVTVVGDTTAGGSGNPIFRELPNGWEYRLSTWLVAEPETFDVLEGKGLPPDIQVDISKKDSIANIDTILERAIDILK